MCVCSRERYALIITPLLVHAQRRLLERISSFGGPTVPQPHFVKTQKATGKEVAQTHMQKHIQGLFKFNKENQANKTLIEVPSVIS